MDTYYTYDDILIKPQFSTIESRKDVSLDSEFLGYKLSLPVMNANMDTVASSDLCRLLASKGAIGALHRFCSIDENIELFKQATYNSIFPIVALGVSAKEIFRASRLFDEVGARVFLVDVAHAASTVVIKALEELHSIKERGGRIIVGNFGSGEELKDFFVRAPFIPDAVKIGVGGGSLCTTRVVTGVGVPTLSSVEECADVAEDYNVKVIADGGIRYIGDIVKSLAAGADMVMLGSMFAGTQESAGRLLITKTGAYKEYRGSASFSSYETQGKVADWRTPEGESTKVSFKGSAAVVLDHINGGIRSACSYVNARNLTELRANARFIHVTPTVITENLAHGQR